jgi:GT2 family glycosyltransferase
VVVPTLAADEALEECLNSLDRQSLRDFEVIVVDNSDGGLVPFREGVKVISNHRNVGFGAAVNQGIRASEAPYIATLNDDAVAHPGWLGALTTAIGERPEIGMCASQVLLAAHAVQLDSAGMLVCKDGSSKQCGHRQPPESFELKKQALLPSGSAAMYRREMLEEIGVFDESFFLYCEDTDLGLRARWAAWECIYVPDAVVEHRYSHSAGAASALKAYYVERNRLYLLVKNFPASMLWAAPFYSLLRYYWHVVYGRLGQGAAAEYQRSRGDAPALALLVLRAHADLLRNLRRLWKERKKIRRRLTPRQFRKLLQHYSISPREVAAL